MSRGTLSASYVIMLSKTVGITAFTLGTLLTTTAHAQSPFDSAPGATTEHGSTPARAATASASTPSDEPRPTVERRWYGAQTLTADAASVSLVVLGAVSDAQAARSALFATGLASYVLTPPIIHFAHGQVGKGFGDLALRIGSVAVGSVVGIVVAAALYDPPHREGLDAVAGAIVDPIVIAAQGITYGGSTGAVVAMAIDGAFLAREDVKVPGVVVKPMAAARPVTFQPTIAPTRSGFSAGLAGTF